jgi:hypothetical protein
MKRIYVYCNNCRFFEENTSPYWFENCKSPKNKHVSYTRTYKNKRTLIEFCDTPSNLNMNNDCEHYERLWWKFWIKEK